MNRNQFYFLPIYILGAFFGYIALAIVIYQWFGVHLPWPKSLSNNVPVAIGTFIILPILAVLLITSKQNHKRRIIGYILILIWFLALIRLLTLFN